MSRLVKFVGDLHGYLEPLHRASKSGYEVIQVGDLGDGFTPIPEFDGHVRWIRGNHDDPSVARKHPSWIPDGHIENQIMFIGGGYSIDRNRRTEGVDFWSDEELSYAELNNLIDLATQVKPNIMVTHEAPISALPDYFYNRPGFTPSRICLALEAIYLAVHPKLWVYGHHHVSQREIKDGTLFVCCDINEIVDIDLDECRVIPDCLTNQNDIHS